MVDYVLKHAYCVIGSLIPKYTKENQNDFFFENSQKWIAC